MYRLLLDLPMEVALVYEYEFDNARTAVFFAYMALPVGFEVVPGEDPRIKDAITVPIRKNGSSPLTH